MYDSDRNPFRSLISLALDDPVLLKASLALAARHRTNAEHSFHQHELASSGLVDSHREALAFKYQAMQGLAQALNDTTSHKKHTTVAAAFLLIFLDLLESGSDKWNFHLEGAKSLITLDEPSPGSQIGVNHGPAQTVQEIRDFITRQIYMYVSPIMKASARLTDRRAGFKPLERPLYDRDCCLSSFRWIDWVDSLQKSPNSPLWDAPSLYWMRFSTFCNRETPYRAWSHWWKLSLTIVYKNSHLCSSLSKTSIVTCGLGIYRGRSHPREISITCVYCLNRGKSVLSSMGDVSSTYLSRRFPRRMSWCAN